MLDDDIDEVERILKVEPRAVDFPSAAGTTALHEAAYSGRTEIALLLMEQFDADPNILDVWGSNCLHFAATRGHDEIARVLVERGCSLDVRRQDGKLPIHLAKEKKHTAVLEFLYHEMLAKKNLQAAGQRSLGRWFCSFVSLICVAAAAIGSYSFATGSGGELDTLRVKNAIARATGLGTT